MQVFFLPVEPGQRFCVFHAPRGDVAARGRVLYVHPFAEEMNKSRRMAALQSRALAEAGFAVLQIDLLGCGDSSGDPIDARWDAWIADLAAAGAWLRERAAGPLWLWGLRGGCLLAAAAAARLGEDCHFLFWQPAAAGKPLMQQFLRLKAAGELIGGTGKGVVEGLRQQLARGEPIEVAGYALPPWLVEAFDRATLAPPDNPAAGRRVEWIELSNAAAGDAPLSPAAARTAERWCTAGFAVTARTVPGPAFWQTVEIEQAPALLGETVAALTRGDSLPAGARR